MPPETAIEYGCLSAVPYAVVTGCGHAAVPSVFHASTLPGDAKLLVSITSLPLAAMPYGQFIVALEPTKVWSLTPAVENSSNRSFLVSATHRLSLDAA